MPAESLIDYQRHARHLQYLEDPNTRNRLLKQFVPTFCYHEQEENFPIHPDDFVKNVIEVKYHEYKNINQTQRRNLTSVEAEELKIIEKYFWKEGEFNPNYKDFENEEDFKKMINPTDGSDSKFLVFDEKKYGYKVGEKIDVVGVIPPGHPKHDRNRTRAPIASSIIPTKEGFFILYEQTYAFNHAIKGTRWLRNILPSSIADKADNFGLHYGDCEGVGIYVNVDAEGKATMKSMQTFAHGRSGAREVPADQCSFDNGRPLVFVGLGGHPSYADNFVGRNKFMDVVGDAYRITPNQIIDLSPDKLAAKSPDIPYSLNTFPRLADSNPMAFSNTTNPKNEQELEVQSKEWHKYKPFLFFTKVWDKMKSLVIKQAPPSAPISINLYNLIELRDQEQSVAMGKTQSLNIWQDKISDSKERSNSRA